MNQPDPNNEFEEILGKRPIHRPDSEAQSKARAAALAAFQNATELSGEEIEDERSQKEGLKELLGKVPKYTVDPEAQSQARDQALAAFSPKSALRPGIRGLLLAAVLLLSGFVVGLLFLPPLGKEAAPTVSAAPKVFPKSRSLLQTSDAFVLLSNGQDLFGAQIEAVVLYEDEVKWFLKKGSQAPSSSSSQAFRLIHFNDSVTNQAISVISTSGGRFRVPGGREFEFLESVDGHHLVAGSGEVIELDAQSVDFITM